MEQKAIEGGRMRPRGGQEELECGQDAEGFGSGQEFPPLLQISCRNLRRMSCRKGLETPLAAGLAAGAGGLGSLRGLGCPPLDPGILIRCHIAVRIIIQGRELRLLDDKANRTRIVGATVLEALAVV